MSKRRKVFSGTHAITILTKHFGFAVVSQKGSHVKLRNNGRTTIVPLHKELARGTLNSVLDLAGVELSDFIKAIEK